MIERLQIRRPHVPHGPANVPDWEADADYLDHAARNIASGYSVGGHNVTATVINLLREVADQLRLEGERQERAEAAAAAIIAECEAEDAMNRCALCAQPILDGDRRVSWFAKTGGEVTERGATHLTCPAKDWDHVHNRPADIYTPPEDRVARPTAPPTDGRSQG